MKLLETYFQRLDEEEKFRTIPGNPVDFFQYVSRYEPELEDMTDEQVEMLVDALEGVQAYMKEYGGSGQSMAEKALNVSFPAMFKRYRYRPDPRLDPNDLEIAGEEIYEWLVVRYEQS